MIRVSASRLQTIWGGGSWVRGRSLPQNTKNHHPNPENRQIFEINHNNMKTTPN
jgi:hypothetical protein